MVFSSMALFSLPIFQCFCGSWFDHDVNVHLILSCCAQWRSDGFICFLVVLPWFTYILFLECLTQQHNDVSVTFAGRMAEYPRTKTGSGKKNRQNVAFNENLYSPYRRHGKRVFFGTRSSFLVL